jgi:hypothetical protein
MRAAGVQVAIGHINDDETRQIRLMPQYAGNLVALNNVPGATGLSWGQALSRRSARRRPRSWGWRVRSARCARAGAATW